VSSPGLFPLFEEDFSMSLEEHKTLLDAKESLGGLIRERNWPPFCKESQCKFDHIPTPFSSFASQKQNPIGYPFLNIVIDDKSLGQPLNTSQMVLSAFIQLVSQARYRCLDHCSSCVGIISNGYRYKFMAFQLNTLDFEFRNTPGEVMNEVWMQEEELYPENWKSLPKEERILNTKVINILGNILRLSYISSLQSQYIRQHVQEVYLNRKQ